MCMRSQCGINTTVSSTTLSVAHPPHQGTADGALEEGHDVFVLAFIGQVERRRATLRINRKSIVQTRTVMQ